MPRRPPPAVVPAQLDALIHTIRGQRVMLDSDLAALYGVTTKVLNQGVERNADRFPEDFAFVLTQEGFANLRSQFVTSSSGYGGRRYPPRAFTEQGVAMLSSVLRSPRAVQVNIEIMRAFVRFRRLFVAPGDFVAELQALRKTVDLHDTQIRAISELLNRMLATPPPAKRKIGFHVPLDHPPAEDAT
jgi:hypothetical protein